jgi:hypothetical protein
VRHAEFGRQGDDGVQQAAFCLGRRIVQQACLVGVRGLLGQQFGLGEMLGCVHGAVSITPPSAAASAASAWAISACSAAAALASAAGPWLPLAASAA